MDGFLAPLDPNPASQLRGSDSRAGKPAADVAAITFGLFTALISIQVLTALSTRQLFCCGWRDEETPQTSVFITYSLTAFFVLLLRCFSIIFILLYFIVFMGIINLSPKVALTNQPDRWLVVSWSCDPGLLPSSVRHPICCNFCLCWPKKVIICLIKVLKKWNKFAVGYKNQMFWSASAKP